MTYEGINFAAVKKLGLVLVIESNAWAYSTPSEYQYLPEDLADRALGYGIPAVIIDGTDACQVYDATREAVERARPEIEAAIAQVKAGEIQTKAHEEAMRAVREAQPQIDAAMKNIGPEIERALAKAGEDLKRAHIDAQIEKSIDDAFRHAQVKIEMHGADAAPDAPGESATDNK